MAILHCAPLVRHEAAQPSPETVRIAVYNVKELSRDKLDRVDAAGRGEDPQLRAAAEVIQRLGADVLLLNEIDHDAAGENARLFAERYLAVPQAPGLAASDYPFVVFEPVNTGVSTGLDLDDDGEVAGDPEDAFGFGRYPGQYGMALYSRFPIDRSGIRTFQRFLWRDMPDNLMPDGEDGTPSWYEPGEVAILRLSSKSHWDVPVEIGDRTLHLLAAHPTPPVFDGEEDRNGRRNFDEIRLWADYLSGGAAASYLVDDGGRRGGLDPDASFVVLGDLNADPWSPEAVFGQPSIRQLLDHPRVADPEPRGPGGAEVEREYAGDPTLRTSDWGRLDFVLPSRDLEVIASGVLWPVADDPLHEVVARASDHRAVWIDVRLR